MRCTCASSKPRMYWFKPKNTNFIQSNDTNRQLKLLWFGDRPGGGYWPRGTGRPVESCSISTGSFSSGNSLTFSHDTLDGCVIGLAFLVAFPECNDHVEARLDEGCKARKNRGMFSWTMTIMCLQSLALISLQSSSQRGRNKRTPPVASLL